MHIYLLLRPIKGSLRATHFLKFVKYCAILLIVTYLSTKGELIYRDENGNNFHQFPSLRALSELTEEELRRQSFGYRAKYIVAATHKIIEFVGEEWLESISNMEYKDCMKALLQLTGVGRKVADCVMLHSVSSFNLHLFCITFCTCF